MKAGQIICMCIASAAVLLVLAPASSYAHTFRSDGPVTVLLHVDPNDTPLTHEASRLDFYVFDADNRFVGAQCTCSVKVTLGSQTILSQAVTFHDSGFNHVAQVPIVFPSLGVYDVHLAGRPRGDYQFHAFQLSYIQRVSTLGYVPANNRSSTLELVALGGGIVIGLAVTVWVARPTKQPVSTPPQDAKGRQR